MKIKIPQNEIPKQVNKGEKYGDIWASWNLDLVSNMGKIRVSPRPYVAFKTSDADALMVNPTAIVRSLSDTISVSNTDGESYFVVCDQAIFKSPIDDLTFIVDTLTNSPTTGLSKYYSDMTDFNGTLVVSQKTDLAKLTTGVWDKIWWATTLAQTALTDGVPHPLCTGFTKELLIGNGNKIASIDSTNTVDTERLVLSSEFEVQWIRGSNSAYWIGCRNKQGGEGKVFMWDGASEYVNGDYKIGSPITFAGVIKDEICYTVNGNGQLLAFSGNGFTEIDRFPLNDRTKVLFDGLGSDYRNPFNINRNGMAVINGNIHILLSAGVLNTTANTNTFLENMLSGIWEYTPETGLYHKYSISKSNDPNINDYGSPQLIQAGAIYPLNDYNVFLAGAELYKNATTYISVINYINYLNGKDYTNNMGYFITPQYHTQELEENWQTLYANFSKLLASGDFIEIKYRTSVDYTDPYNDGTWTTTNSITVNDVNFATVEVGDEVEILSGEGSGLSANITGITGTYVATIDRTVAGASGTISLRTANWTKIDTITSLNMAYKEFSIQKNSNWIQFKVVMYGKGNSPEIEKLTLISNPQLKTI